MRGKLPVLLILLLSVLSAASMAGVAAGQQNTTANTTPEDINTNHIERQFAHVQVHDIEWDDGDVTVSLTPTRDDTIQITGFKDQKFTWNSYRVEAGKPTTLTYTLEQKFTEKVAISSVSAETGIILQNPLVNPISFNRGAKWTDHWISIPSAVTMVVLLVLYRYKRKEYLAQTGLRSLISGRVYRRKDYESDDESRWSRFKKAVVRHFYSPRSILLGVIGLLLVELFTGWIFARFAALHTEMKLAVLVAVLGTPVYYWVAGRILGLLPDGDQPVMLTLDNRENGGWDVLTGAKEMFNDMRVKGANALRKKRVAGTNDREYIAHHYEPEQHTAVATWHQILDTVQVARNYTAAFVNYYLLSSEIDEAREIKSAQPALRHKYQSEAQHTSMRKMDETHFEDGRATNDVMADVMDSLDHGDDEDKTVESDEVEDVGSEDSVEPEGDSDGE